MEEPSLSASHQFCAVRWKFAGWDGVPICHTESGPRVLELNWGDAKPAACHAVTGRRDQSVQAAEFSTPARGRQMKAGWLAACRGAEAPGPQAAFSWPLDPLRHQPCETLLTLWGSL